MYENLTTMDFVGVGLTSKILKKMACLLYIVYRITSATVCKPECGKVRGNRYVCLVLTGLYLYLKDHTYIVRSKSFRPDRLFKVIEIKQLCYFST